MKTNTYRISLFIALTIIIVTASLVITSPVHAFFADDFVITVKTDNPGTSSDTQFTIPTYSGETYNYRVDCDNDGIDEATDVTGDYNCHYDTPGTYTIRIKDNARRLKRLPPHLLQLWR